MRFSQRHSKNNTKFQLVCLYTELEFHFMLDFPDILVFFTRSTYTHFFALFIRNVNLHVLNFPHSDLKVRSYRYTRTIIKCSSPSVMLWHSREPTASAMRIPFRRRCRIFRWRSHYRFVRMGDEDDTLTVTKAVCRVELTRVNSSQALTCVKLTDWFILHG